VTHQIEYSSGTRPATPLAGAARRAEQARAEGGHMTWRPQASDWHQRRSGGGIATLSRGEMSCPRGDLNTKTREISPIRGNFHGLSITTGAHRRQAFHVRPASWVGRRAMSGRAAPGQSDPARRSRSVLSAESGQAKYPPFCTGTVPSIRSAGDAQNAATGAWVRRTIRCQVRCDRLCQPQLALVTAITCPAYLTPSVRSDGGDGTQRRLCPTSMR
jgi:hypothetical protein